MAIKKVIDVLFSFFLGIAVTAGAGVMLIKAGLLNITSVDMPSAPRQNQWNIPSSNETGYSFVDSKSKEIHVYNFVKNKLLKADNKVLCCGGAQYLGNMEPQASPNLLYSAFIDSETSGLGIVSHQTLKSVVIPGTKGVRYISGWSPNSSKILIYFENNNVETANEGMIPWDSDSETFPSQSKRGFYLVDLNKQNLTELYPVTGFIGFLSDNEVLVKSDNTNYRVIVFNTDEFKADYTRVKDAFHFGTGQYDISRDSKTWTFTDSANPTEDMKVVWADFPNKEGIVVDNGGWADVQWPKISPDGTKLAYQRHKGLIRSGVPAPYLWVATKTDKQEVAPGKPVRWIDSSKIIVERILDGEFLPREFGILNVETKEYTKIY